MIDNTRITPEYLAEQKKLHACGYYGAYSQKWLGDVLRAIRVSDAGSVLDYGCGQGKLVHALRSHEIGSMMPIHGYDPAVPEWSREPLSADLVVCTDVLEHIEPACLSAVLDHLSLLTGDMLLVVIATRPATRQLSDGRNAHLIIEPAEFWRQKFAVGWDVADIPWHEVSTAYDPKLEWMALLSRRWGT